MIMGLWRNRYWRARKVSRRSSLALVAQAEIIEEVVSTLGRRGGGGDDGFAPGGSNMDGLPFGRRPKPRSRMVR